MELLFFIILLNPKLWHIIINVWDQLEKNNLEYQVKIVDVLMDSIMNNIN